MAVLVAKVPQELKQKEANTLLVRSATPAHVLQLRLGLGQVLAVAAVHTVEKVWRLTPAEGDVLKGRQHGGLAPLEEVDEHQDQGEGGEGPAAPVVYASRGGPGLDAEAQSAETAVQPHVLANEPGVDHGQVVVDADVARDHSRSLRSPVENGHLGAIARLNVMARDARELPSDSPQHVNLRVAGAGARHPHADVDIAVGGPEAIHDGAKGHDLRAVHDVLEEALQPAEELVLLGHVPLVRQLVSGVGLQLLRERQQQLRVGPGPPTPRPAPRPPGRQGGVGDFTRVGGRP
mmetsp:Transcript_75678/g.225594  ORF Transcript_75678/g.225594 Transcript_75678/m.225594 type:complete len:291 (-) Transcript_75678:267-1139(-)